MVIERLSPSHVSVVADLFGDLAKDRFFRPHPMTRDEAVRACANQTSDVYLGAFRGGDAVAYGLLRGIAKGLPPSLGVAVRSRSRGHGVGTRMINALHGEARNLRLSTIRIRVHPDNPAKRLYEKVGYRFSGELDRGELVGWIEL